MVTRIDPGVASDSRLSAWLTVANASVSSAAFGIWADEAAAALCAHYLRSMPATGTGRGSGAIQSENFTDRSVTYATPTAAQFTSPAKAALAGTVGGTYYLQLLARAPRVGQGLL